MVERSEARRAVAAVVRRPDGLVFAVRRPGEPGEELPNIWGLPATTIAAGESAEDAIRRLGCDKLSVDLTPLRALAEGEQSRAEYTLGMTVYECSMSGEPQLPRDAPGSTSTLYEALDWLPAPSFADAAARGSLCCELLLGSLTPDPSPASGRGELADRRAGRQRLRIPSDVRARMVKIARGLRQQPTHSEELLWGALRNRQLAGLKFRRQHAIGPFVVDFYCAEQLLVVEVDGALHQSLREHDAERQALLEACGLQFLRVSAYEIEHDMANTLLRIERLVRGLTDIPLSRSRERG